MCQTDAGNAREGEPSSAQTATEAALSEVASAGTVTDASGCGAPSVEALVATLSADAELVTLARAYVEASRARWRSMMTPPYNADKDVDHWQLAKDTAVAWQAWCAALNGRRIETGDRRGLAEAVAVAGTGAEREE